MYKKAASIIKSARRVCAFTGAGISVESGIPPFRGDGGLWTQYDPRCLDIDFFQANPKESWIVIKEIFYDFFGKAEPNAAHLGLAGLEQAGKLGAVITQNIDNLHQLAGSKVIYEFHGNSQKLLCLECGKIFPVKEIDLKKLPPKCPSCGGLLKPDFVFFGEPIPDEAHLKSLIETELSDVFLVIGTTGEVMPACMIPIVAKQRGAVIIEMNPEKSAFTNRITDLFIREKAAAAMTGLLKAIGME